MIRHSSFQRTCYTVAIFQVDSAAQSNHTLVRGEHEDFDADEVIDTDDEDRDDAAGARGFWSGDESSDYDSGGKPRKR